MNRYDGDAPEDTTHYKLFPFGTDYFFKVERTFTGDKWFLFGDTWQEYTFDRQDPDVWPIHCRPKHGLTATGRFRSQPVFQDLPKP